MNSRDFSLGLVLTITHDKMIAMEGMGGVRDILSHLTGCEIHPFQTNLILYDCKKELLNQYPTLNDPRIKEKLAEMSATIQKNRSNGKSEEYAKAIVVKVIKDISSTIGIPMVLEINPIEGFEERDVLEDAISIFGANNVIPVLI